MNIKNLLKTILLTVSIFATNNNCMAQNSINTTSIDNYIKKISEINSKYDYSKLRGVELTLQRKNNNNENIVDHETSQKIMNNIKWIIQSAENLKNNIFTMEDNCKLETCVSIIKQIINELQQKQKNNKNDYKANKQQYKDTYEDLNEMIKICKTLQKIGNKSRVILNGRDLPNDLISKFQKRLQFLLNNKEFMTNNRYEIERNLVFTTDNSGNKISTFLNKIDELKYNINSYPLINNKISKCDIDSFIEYFTKNGIDIEKVLDNSKSSIDFDFIKGNNCDNCLQEIFYLEIEIQTWFAQKYGAMKSK